MAVITGTTREGRFSGLVAEWITGHLAEHPEFELESIDLRDHPLPFFDGMAPARTGRDYPRDDVAALGNAIDRVDGFVVLTGEYNHGYPAVLKNAMDWRSLRRANATRPNVVDVIDPKPERDDAPHTPDGPPEIEDAAAQELEIPADEGDEG